MKYKIYTLSESHAYDPNAQQQWLLTDKSIDEMITMKDPVTFMIMYEDEAGCLFSYTIPCPKDTDACHERIAIAVMNQIKKMFYKL